ncbi:hypothetical protein F4777DRAFT_562825 [Nemania sp. FL0916]|nr:hypothetical protein F4777DRAFT_562825 [Nemania sp. FL0916]
MPAPPLPPSHILPTGLPNQRQSQSPPAGRSVRAAAEPALHKDHQGSFRSKHTPASTTSSIIAQNNPPDASLSGWEIAGAVIGGVVGAFVLVGILYVLWVALKPRDTYYEAAVKLEKKRAEYN